MEWMLMPYKKLYAAIAGRSSRQEYWMFVLLNVIIAVIFLVLIFAFIGGMAGGIGSMSNPGSLVGAMMGVGIVGVILLVLPFYAWAILTSVAGFCVTIRRLHDLNLSGWFYLIFLVLFLIPLINFLAWIGLIVVMCLPGTKGPNKWGEDPTVPGEGAGVFS